MKAAEGLHWQALTISEEIDELRGEALCRYNLGCLASDQEEYAVAEAFLQASLDRYHEIGRQPGVGFAASQFGAVVGRTADRRAEADCISPGPWMSEQRSARRRFCWMSCWGGRH